MIDLIFGSPTDRADSCAKILPDRNICTEVLLSVTITVTITVTFTVHFQPLVFPHYLAR